MSNNPRTLYSPQFEHDACGIGFIAHLKGQKSHKVIDGALTMLENMEHRGATGSEANTGDGAGILVQVPHDYYTVKCRKIGFELPEFGQYGVGMIFFPADDKLREECRAMLNLNIDKFGFKVLGYRRVPTNNHDLGSVALNSEPVIEQVFVAPKYIVRDFDALERRLFVLRKYSNHSVRPAIDAPDFYICSLSYKTIVYKGQLTSSQLRLYYPDLSEDSFTSALAVIHSRFSTNTFPRWKLAQPFRFIAHNGEINTVRGNVNWMKSYETLFRSSYFSKEELELILPLLDETQSDSSNLDKVAELLLLGGRSLAHVMMMLVPEAHEGNHLMTDPKKAFYEYHASMIEPWDGPASLCVTDGKMIGATLDRNGLRPSRYCVTKDDFVIMGSEAGSLPVDQANVVMKGRVEAGKIFIVDMEQGRIISDEELKQEICTSQDYRKWITENSVKIADLHPAEKPTFPAQPQTLLQRHIVNGYTLEDFRTVLGPMFVTGKEPIGSMGADTPIAVLSDESQNFCNYFRQLFAQVSNPPMDPIRERMVMSLSTSVGKTLDILAEKPSHCRVIKFPQPILTNEELDKVRIVDHPNFKCATIDTTFPVAGNPGDLEKAIDRICQDAEDAIRFGCYNVLLLSDRSSDAAKAPIPGLLAVSSIHQHLTRNGLRARAGLIVESADLRETHHFATVIGYGANAVNPYMVYESIPVLREQGLIPESMSDEQAIDNYIHAIDDGLLKIFSKMGISTLRSYHGAQIFEILGLNTHVVNKSFNGSVSRIEGLDYDDIAREVLIRHHIAYTEDHNKPLAQEFGGVYNWRRKGEAHLMDPDAINLLQDAVRNDDFETYQKFSEHINNQDKAHITIRSLFDFKKERKPILLEEVEPVEKILTRFATGAMSFGSISHEAHSTLAIAMNRIGAKSNSGEGGEDPIRYEKLPNGDSMRSAIKQVASGRFGVTSYYLSQADELQIKIAQGAKPGEGGQLPGDKVNDWIGRVRHSTPGVGLISPPPHHDIYSIEDLSQLIYDLKKANRAARISVKLVSSAGVGTIAAGVAKAKADSILIAGGDGGTGASPISSVRYTGLPWELGLAEAHQTLVMNNLRSRVVLQTDGQIRTGRDIAIATMLGAEEWGIATAALVAEGCIMMRKCHSNTCPVGVATQDEELRKRFSGQPEYVINYLTFIVRELRQIMAELGFRTINEMVGQSDVLKVKENINKWKVRNLDLTPILYKVPAGKEVGLYKQHDQVHLITNSIDWKLIDAAKASLETGAKSTGDFEILNTNRAAGTMLSNEISKKYKGEGLPEDTISFNFRGSAGQSFGAFAAPGLTMRLEGETNDYVGKGLSGAKIIITPDRDATFDPHVNIIAGNVAFYGATSGEAYISGIAGQRFCVRNSGAKVVVEGVGGHGCEYMTGGLAIILGKTGLNFAAGMSGGVAYVYDVDKTFPTLCNKADVFLETLETEDQEVLRHYISRHVEYTKSKYAANILKNLDKEFSNFVKVMPKDYKRVLEKRKKEQLEAVK